MCLASNLSDQFTVIYLQFFFYTGGVQVVDIKKTSATIQWTDGAPNGQPIYVYIISGRTTYNSTWLNVTRGLLHVL